MEVVLPPPAEKARAVRAMFDRIAPRYDRMNRILTARLDGGWRRAALAAAALAPGDVAIDVACGTGDLAELARRAGARVIGVDFAPAMLAIARRRQAASWLVRADAAALPLAAGAADAVTCGFSLRNFVAIEPFLAEASRVLAPGGRLVVLEVAIPRHPVKRFVHRLYFDRVVPLVGGLLSDRAAYAYLPRSVVYLPDTPRLVAMVERAGFAGTRVAFLGGGAIQLLAALREPAR